MTDTTAVHDRFTLERRYPASPERVFAAYATQEPRTPGFPAPTTIGIRSRAISISGSVAARVSRAAGKTAP